MYYSYSEYSTMIRHSLSHTETIQPVCLPRFDQIFSDGLECRTSGFGTTQEAAGTGR